MAAPYIWVLAGDFYYSAKSFSYNLIPVTSSFFWCMGDISLTFGRIGGGIDNFRFQLLTCSALVYLGDYFYTTMTFFGNGLGIQLDPAMWNSFLVPFLIYSLAKTALTCAKVAISSNGCSLLLSTSSKSPKPSSSGSSPSYQLLLSKGVSVIYYLLYFLDNYSSKSCGLRLFFLARFVNLILVLIAGS